MRYQVKRLEEKVKRLDEEIGGVICDYVRLKIDDGTWREYPWDEALMLIAAGHAKELEIDPARVQNGELAALCRMFFEGK